MAAHKAHFYHTVYSVMFLVNDIKIYAIYAVYYVLHAYLFYTDFEIIQFLFFCLFVFLTAQQLAYINPHAYNCSLPSPYYTEMAEMAQICAGKTIIVVPRRRLEKLMSVKGETFLSFAKSHNFVDGKH